MGDYKQFSDGLAAAVDQQHFQKKKEKRMIVRLCVRSFA